MCFERLVSHSSGFFGDWSSIGEQFITFSELVNWWLALHLNATSCQNTHTHTVGNKSQRHERIEQRKRLINLCHWKTFDVYPMKGKKVKISSQGLSECIMNPRMIHQINEKKIYLKTNNLFTYIFKRIDNILVKSRNCLQIN